MTKKDYLNLIQSLPKLIRLGVSLAVTFSAATGYIVASRTIESELFLTLTGVLLLSGGASALNQYQERKTDALMNRTMGRPIPSGKITPLTGLMISLLLCFSGIVVLFIYAGYTPALLGIFNLIWYNGLYTHLKKKTAFAVVPGSLTGVTPILIGWSAAGGNLLNPVIIFISFFIYMWQIPHFWLLLIRYSDDYKKAGLGSLSKSLSLNQSKRIVFAWIIGTAITSLLLPYFGIIQSVLLIFILIIATIWVSISFYRIIFERSNNNVINLKKAFIELNAFMLVVMLLLILESTGF
ncbi:MAG: protoheme IX farnesyltransferase [Bacteroidales bacterium]